MPWLKLKIKLILLFQVIFCVYASFAQQPVIRSLRVYPAGDETALPVINGSDITIEFDVEAGFEPELNIVFRFCDRNWTPTNNLFLINHGKNIAYFLDLVTLPNTVEEAKFRFSGNFPSDYEDIEFPYSGKWMFFITESNDTSVVYASGKFYAVNEEITLNTTFKHEQLEDKVYFPADLAKVLNITSVFYLSDELFPAFVDYLEIIANKKLSYPVIVDRNFNTNTRQYYWDGNRKFSFTARDIHPGNEYRQADLRNTNIFSTKNVRAQFDGTEYSRFFKEGNKDLNGGSVLINYKNDFATYLNVEFSVRPPEEITGDIFLTGDFNNWELLPEYRMINTAGIYKKSVLLKRGVYDYQYVTADYSDGVIKNADWLVLEGNSFKTSNVFHVFLYYRDPDYGGYDKIIGYSKIITD